VADLVLPGGGAVLCARLLAEGGWIWVAAAAVVAGVGVGLGRASRASG
jgi:hypothetical protein